MAPEAEVWAAGKLGLAPIRVREVVTYYTMFRAPSGGRTVIEVCRNLSCTLAGSEDLVGFLRERLGLSPGSDTTADGRVTLVTVECLGNRDHSPCLQVDGVDHGPHDEGQGRSTWSGSSRRNERSGRSFPSLRRRIVASGLVFGPGRLRGRPQGRDVHAPCRYRDRGPQGGPPGQGRRGLSGRVEVVVRPAGPARSAVSLRERRRVRAGDVQGPRASSSRDPHLLLEGMIIAAYAVGVQHGLHLHPRRVRRIAGRRPGGGDRRGHAAGLPRHGRLRQRASTSTSSSTAAPAPTSAARRRPCIESLEGKRGQPAAQAAVPRRRRPVRRADGHQQRRDARPACRSIIDQRRRLVHARSAGPKERGPEALLRQRPRRTARASTSCRSGSPSRELIYEHVRRHARRASAARRSSRAARRRRS
ncbi:MAG: NAD(P)H-dependent oxidoreductase subunit E [Candidatus Moduliflexus flocculans]|nr:NAD(P)H-dependent oxidoreductase subunit E [Candidatus Moduliflexus flocculans]